MTARTTITSFITEPALRFTNDGKPVLNFSMNATPSKPGRRKNTYEDDGAPLWISVSFWEDEAERLAELLHKGDRVTVEGTLRMREFTTKAGTTATSLEVKNARFLGLVSTKN